MGAGRRQLIRVMVLVFGVVMMGAACNDDGGAPELTDEQRDDPALVTGEEVFAAQCGTCHADDGGGRAGNPALVGIEDRYPEIEDQIAVIEGGRGGMPSFSDRLTDEEIEAVARYEREVL